MAANEEPRALVMDGADTVATLLDPARPGEVVALLDPGLRRIGTVESIEAIEAFHKVATREMAAGDAVRKFGEVIGRASRGIAVGDHVHVHNAASARV